jgi:formiminotetrahydrofolate cyclodeaminase
MLAELTVKGFLGATAGSDPVPGGGSVSALNGAVAAALGEMVANLTIGKKKYEDREPLMRKIAAEAAALQAGFVKAIDEDSDAYNAVFEAFKLPKETDEEKAARSQAIQAATKVAAEVPLQVARRAAGMMEMLAQVAAEGNQNAITDACVAMMCARNAVLGAALNVRINLGSLKDEVWVERVRKEVEELENQAVTSERELLEKVKEIL